LRALVTGAAGFAGSHLVELLLARGFAVQGLVFPGGSVANLTAVERDPHLTIVEADLRDAERVSAVIETARPDQIYHLAAESSVGQSLHDPRPAFRANTFGSLHVMEAVRRAGLPARVLVVSSAEVYGESGDRNHRIHEAEPLRPVTPYGASKAAAEIIARRYAMEWGLMVVRVRPFTHTGPRHDPRFAFSDWARQLVEIEAGRQPPRLRVGNLDICRDISDVRDVVEGYVQLLTHGQTGSVYNLCSGRGHVLHDVLDQLIGLAGLQVTVEKGADRLRAQDIRALVGSPEALRARTGWEATIPLAQTLADLLAYWRQRQPS
jgi:GDP-4-dehydro-6-deoxy-D-mannose reductase